MKILDFKTFFKMREDIENRVNTLLDNQDFIFFFKKENDLYGANEGARMVFAKLKEKTNNKEDPKNWKKEASFMATNLTKAIQGENSKSVFSKKDIKKIKTMDRDNVFKELIKKAKKEKIDAESEIPIDKILLPSPEYETPRINIINMDNEE